MQNMHKFMQSRRRWLRWGVLSAWTLPWLVPQGVVAQPGPASAVKILAASDLKFALTRIADQYQRETGQAIDVSYGSSGNMARQIQQGLPADIFMSADEDLVLQLAKAGVTRASDTGVLYALGRLALYIAPGVSVEPDVQLLGLRRDWDQVHKFSIANADHAPYGRAAREALQTLNLWSLVQPRLVLGDNIAQATQFVGTGAAQAGITALSLVMAPELKGLGRYVALPAHLHKPLRQRMVLLQSARAPAIAFYAYLQQPAARAVLAEYGFVPPP